MPPEEDQNHTEAAQQSLKLAFGLVAQVAVWTIGVLVLGLVGGLWLDSTLGTGRLFTVVLLLAGLPLSLFIIYRVALNTVKKIRPAAGKRPRAKEDYGSRDT